ncbi:hypothetical protein F4776DRAFT_648909 [Hypoxylon sp. NC0597]|nr:hypothetical protein F4776DRAFT_648909 [Hypoxylon sp. NC0597]
MYEEGLCLARRNRNTTRVNLTALLIAGLINIILRDPSPRWPISLRKPYTTHYIPPYYIVYNILYYHFHARQF